MKPLAHLTMLDLTHMLSGPYAGMVLADLGAHTIKVEPVGTGEGTRRLLEQDPKHSIHGMGAYFLTLNRNKESVCIDLKRPEGREVFYDLVRKVDIVLDNFSAGVTERLAIDHASLAMVNPRIITCSVTGFGQTGPEPNRPAFDVVAQGMGGGMSITGTEESGPTRAGIPIGDLGGGLFGVIGVLSAVAAREQTGRGQHVDISMLDAQISLLNYIATMYFLSGENPRPEGNGHVAHVPYNTFRTKTRHIIIAVIVDSFWDALVEALDDDDLRKPEYRLQPGRFADRDFINGRVQAHLETESCEHWLEVLKEARVPAAPVNELSHALNDPQVLARDMVVQVAHPDGPTTKMPGNPVKLSDTATQSYSPPPLVGQHTDQVLAELLDYDAATIARLRADRVVG